MSRTLYLHIGTHKTGTTSIQTVLAGNAEALAAKGFGYATGRNGLNLSGPLGGASIGDAEEGDAGKAMALRRVQVVEEIAKVDQPNVIASTEAFSYLFAPKSIQLYHDELKAHFDTIKVICYIRRQDEFAVSHHQEGANPQRKPAVKLHGFSPTALPETSDLQFKYLDYVTRIGMWADAFGDDAMIVRVYNRATLKNGDFVADFLDIFRMTPDEFVIKKDKNVSMGFLQAKIGHILGEIIGNQQAKHSVLARLPSADKLLPRRDDAIQFVERYVEGNRRLNARLNISDRPNLFSDDFSAYPEEGCELWTEGTLNDAIRACAEVIESLSSDAVPISVKEYVAAANAVANSSPETARKLLTAALKLRPLSEPIRAKLEAIGRREKHAGGSGARLGKMRKRSGPVPK